MRNRTLRLTVLIASACLMLLSCEKAHFRGLYGGIGGAIKVNVSAGNMVGTKSGIDAYQAPIRVISSDGGDIQLEEYVSDYPSEMSPDYTRGAAITTNSDNPITGKTFYIEGWLGADISDPIKGKDAETADKNDYHFIKKNSVSYNSGSWSISGENFWRNGIPTTFWSYVPPTVGTLAIQWPGSSVYRGTPFTTYASPDKPTDSQQKVLSFNYTLPSPGGSDNDAYALQDFLFAYNNETRSLDDDGNITDGKSESFDIKFRHPLSAVKFMMGTINGGNAPNTTDDEYVNITKVELVNVKTSGSFTATGSDTNKCTIACNSTSGSATYSQAATRAEIAGGKFTDAGSEYVFFMIPQDASNVTVKLTMVRKKKNVVYDIDGTTILSTTYGEDITFTREVSLSGAWLPGEYYTYKINSTVYFGGEEVTLPNVPSSSSGIEVDSSGNLTFNISGRTEFNEWVAPLPTKGVNVLKLTFTHTYTNSSGKSARRIWLGDACVNPEWTGPDDTVHPHFINRDARKTYDSDLVAEAVALTNASTYWGSPVHYTGYLGEYTIQSNGQVTASAYDKNMNNSGGATNIVSTMYFYLGGNFDYVTVHFEYLGSTGGGSVGWSASVPLFNITEVVD